MKRLSNKLPNWIAAAVVVTVIAACGVQPPVEVDYTLSVTIDGTGTGTVVSVPAGIDATADATADFAEGTEVELTATAAAGSEFTGWSGDCTGTGACTVTLDADASVTATFTEEVIVVGPFDLTVNANGSGTGSVTSDLTGLELAAGDTTTTVAVDASTVVTLTATAEPDSVFAGWTGDCTGSGTCVVTMDAAAEVTASFVLAVDATAATFNILAGSDDAEEYISDVNAAFPAGSVDLTSADLDLAFDTALNDTAGARGAVTIGLRYGNVTIPQGAVITEATITFTRESSSGSTVTFLIEGQSVDDAPTFAYDAVAPANNDITGRARTTANVAWAPASLVALEVATDDVSTIVQEIVDRAGWAADNGLAFIITSNDSSSSNVLRAFSFEGAGAAAVLSVSYVTPVAP